MCTFVFSICCRVTHGSFVGLEEDGLFRRSPNLALLNQVTDAYDRGNKIQYRSRVTLNSRNDPASGHVMSLDTFNDPHLAAVLIKKFLRDLPTPIFPEHAYPVILRCPVPSDEPGDVSAITYIRETILPELPRCSYILLSHVLRECSSIHGFVLVMYNGLFRTSS